MDQIETDEPSSRHRFRVLVGAAAALVVVVAVAAAVLVAGDDADDDADTARTDTTPSTQPTDETTAPPSSTTTTTAPPPASTPEVSSGSIRGVDFGAMTYPTPFPALDPNQDVTLHDGTGAVEMPDAQQRQAVELQPVAYGDLDGDGDEDALVVLFAHHQRAELAEAWAAAYRIGAGGSPEIVGTPLAIGDNVAEIEPPSGKRVTATVYPGDDLSSTVQRTWEFDGDSFEPLG